MLVKDEVDVLQDSLPWLLSQVDEVIVMDNLSMDGTSQLLAEIAKHDPLVVIDDHEVAYLQSAKTTAMAQMALERGHDWVIPCDADELWHTGDFRPIKHWLGGLAPDITSVTANLYNHLPTNTDNPEFASPVERIGWRQRDHAPLPKVCARTNPLLVVDPGNHSVSGIGGTQGGTLNIRHYSWRSPEQYVRKIVNGAAAYAAAGTLVAQNLGDHWRMWQGRDEAEIDAHYHRWFVQENPDENASLIYDPFPLPWLN